MTSPLSEQRFLAALGMISADYGDHDRTLQISPQRLLALDRFKQRFEVSLAEATASPALDDLIKESWAILHRLGEDLQQMALFVLIYQNPQLPHFLFQLGRQNVSNSLRKQVVIAVRNREGHYEVINKFQGALWSAEYDHSPLDVVGWHGNYAPYKYDLNLFNTIGSISFDHPDPSIFTVLTSPSEIAGNANIDLAVFTQRWLVAEHTFRPPWFHRNFMNEFMGLITGEYDAKAEGFAPGGASLHNCMAGHGPDAATYEQATQSDLKPVHLADTLAFMFETRYVVRPTKYAMDTTELQGEYYECWQGLKKNFKA